MLYNGYQTNHVECILVYILHISYDYKLRRMTVIRHYDCVVERRAVIESEDLRPTFDRFSLLSTLIYEILMYRTSYKVNLFKNLAEIK